MTKKAAPSRYKKFNTKLAILVLLVVAGIILIGKLTGFIIKLYSPIYAISSVSRNYVWDGKSNISFILKSTETSVVSYNPVEGKLTLISLPNNLYLDLPNGMGKWQLSSVYDLGSKSSDTNGGVLLKRSLGNLFNTPIEGYLVSNIHQSPKEIIEGVRGGLWGSVSLFSSEDSDLTPSEILKIVLGIRSVRFDKVELLSLATLDALETTKLPDGTIVSSPNLNKLNNLGKFTESVVETEKASVAIYNATDTPGLAQKVAQVITNMGGNVIFVGNTDNIRTRSVIFTKELSSDQSKNKTANVLGIHFTSSCTGDLKCDTILCDVSKSENALCQADLQIIESRAQINLVVGKDFDGRF